MKKLGRIFTLGLITLIPTPIFAANSGNISNIFEAIDFIKSIIDFDNVNIKSDIPYDKIQTIIEKYCTKDSVDKAKKELGPLNEVWISYIDKPNINKSLSDRFDLVKGLILEEKKDVNQYNYCKNTYLLFSILKTTQDLYTGEKDSKTKKTSYSQNTSTQKNQNLTQQPKSNEINEHNSATKNIDFTFIHDTTGLPDKAKKTFSDSTEKYLQEIMSDLVDINILDENDLKTMNNKIKVTYQQSCEITEGTFRVTRNKQTGKISFKEIKLIIAYCNKNNTPERQKRHVQQILAHELGHYIYFFKDKNPSKFSEICWDNGKMNCLPEEFVSNYATKSQEEDYAESFAYWYLYNTDESDNQHGAAPDNPINKRARYFEDLFEEEKEDDDEKD